MDLSLADAYGLLASNRDLINATWHFFVSVHLGLFAVALFSPRRGGSRFGLIMLQPFYLGFMYLNYNAQLDNYLFSSAILDYISAMSANNAGESEILTASFRKGWLLPYLMPIYAATAGFSTALVLWFAFMGDRSRKRAA